MRAIDSAATTCFIGRVNEVDGGISWGGASGGPAAATVLAVEDETVLRLLIELSLGRAGYKVLGAASGEEALRLWGEHPGRIDLLVTDVILPGAVDGIALIRRLRAECPALRVICTSGSGGDRIVLGPDGGERPTVVVKPYESADLVAAVQRVLAGTPGR